MLIPLPSDGLPPENWIIEPVACCLNAVDRARVECGDRVALVGCGFMGNILLQSLLRTPAAEIAVFDTREEQRQRALDYRDAVVTAHDATEVSTDLDAGFDVVIETSAHESGFHLANRLTRKAGRLVVFSWHHSPFPIDLGHWHRNGTTVLNVSPATHPDFDQCFYQARALISSGRIDVATLVTHAATAESAQELFASGLAKTDGYLKGMVRWNH